MARIRTIKPEFFRHEGLQDLEAANPGKQVMLVFAGLWGHCDKAGRFEWKPRQLKLDILPFLEFDMVETLGALERAGFLRSYEVAGRRYGVIPSFADHQRINGKEAQEPEKHPPQPFCEPEPTCETDLNQSGTNREATWKQPGSNLPDRKGREEEGKGNGEARGARPLQVPDLVADGLTEQTSVEWLAHRKRKRAPLTPIAWNAIKAEAEKAGWPIEDAILKALARGWQGLEAEWLRKDGDSRRGRAADGGLGEGPRGFLEEMGQQ